MSKSTKAKSACRDALALRSWALRMATRCPGGPGAEGWSVPDVAPPAWDVFLARERCASLLLDGSGERPAPGGSSGRASLPPLVRSRSRDEARRSLAARAQLQRIDGHLRSAGVEAVVLKGGVPVALGATLNLADLDLLVAPRHARRVAALLERSEGMVVSGTDPRVGGRGMTHLAPRVATGDIPVEVHFDLHYVPDPDAARDRAVHLADFAALRMLTPAEHLQHVVVHSALQHPERRGSLRDLAVIRHAIAMCTEGELRAAHRGLSRGEATAVLEFVLELTSGRVPVDPFRRTAAVGYLIAARFRDRSPVTLRHLAASAVALAESPRAYLQLLRASVDPWELESSVAWVAALGRRMPRLGRAVRIAGALGRLALVALPAARVAWSARRLAGKE